MKSQISYATAQIRDHSTKEARLNVKQKNHLKWGDFDIISTDYHSYALAYSCKMKRNPYSLWLGKKKEEFVWVLTRKPLDILNVNLTRSNPEIKEFERIKYLTRNILAKKVPGFDFENNMRRTIQAERNGCDYPKDDL